LPPGRRGWPDVILLDEGLPGRNGLDVWRESRRQGFESPVIFVSGKT
jgi:DNA-binding response OmpR family regulator